MRRAPLSTALLVAATLVLAGCGGGDSSDSEPPATQKVSGGSVIDATWPLTGLPVTGDKSASLTHPVLVTKMDNTEASSPQIGLGEADMVVEELVEGGLTRLAAFYYSQIPGRVGPVRSMRASDIGIVSPIHGTMVTSGAAARTIALIKGAHIPFFQEGAKGFARDSSRSAPYNLFADLKDIAAQAKIPAARPDDYLPWGSAKDLPKGKRAKTIDATFSGSHTTDWKYDGKGYVNENSNAAPGDQFPTDTVLVLRVQVGDAGYLDPAGNPVPETKLTGKGDALIFHGGRVVRCTWSKDGLGAPLSLSTKAGKVSVPAGHTWIELVPAKTGSVRYSK